MGPHRGHVAYDRGPGCLLHVAMDAALNQFGHWCLDLPISALFLCLSAASFVLPIREGVPALAL